MKIKTDDETLEKLDRINILRLLEVVSLGNLVRGVNWALDQAGVLWEKASTLPDIEPRSSKKREDK